MSPGEKIDHSDLIYDWNRDSEILPKGTLVEFDDETLRDGLQSPSVTTPTLETKIRILHLMNDLGLHTADIGLPGAGPHVLEDVIALAKEIRDQKLNIRANCAGRTVIADIEPIAKASQEVGLPIEACLFIGSSEIRRVTEDWNLDQMLRHTEESVRFAVERDLPVMCVTEDTARARPETIRQIYTVAIESGAKRICVCDTVGHSTPNGVKHLIEFVASVVRDSGEDVGIDWHGHNDRGLGLINTLAALEAGAQRLHGTAIGIGERCGNTAMDQLLVNLKLMGVIDNDLSSLPAYCDEVSRAVSIPIPSNYPAIGSDAFETGTGVHAAAVIKAIQKGDHWLADRVYSGVPAADLGREQSIRVGPMSGRSNVIFWLQKHGQPTDDGTVDRIFQAAKESKRLLTDEEIRTVLARG
ncbi:MAG: LeuA family protein [Planctomycetota bacterium]